MTDNPVAMPIDDAEDVKPRGRPFEPGVSGNPNGRPRGSRNKATLMVEALLDDQAEAITRKLLTKAEGGDMTAIRLVIDRLAPVRKGRRVTFDLPEIASTKDAVDAMAAVLRACASGAMTIDEATEFCNMISGLGRLLDLGEIESRLKTLEQKIAEDSQK